MSPAEFLNQDIPVDEDLSDMAGVIAANFIVLDAFVFAMILLVELPNPISQVLGLRALVVVIEGDHFHILIINIY